MDPIQDITGVILAGGRSSRFGSNKAFALLHGKPLIQHVTDSMTAVFKDCLLVTNTPELYGFLNLPMIRDHYRDMGPMAGIHAALHHVDNPWIFVVGCDMPAVTPELIGFLCSFRQKKYDAIIPWLATGPEPLCGLYQQNAITRMIGQHLKNRRAQVKGLLKKLTVKKIDETQLLRVTGGLQAFFNINRQEDLKQIS